MVYSHFRCLEWVIITGKRILDLLLSFVNLSHLNLQYPFWFQIVSIMEAVEKHPHKERIVDAMEQPIADPKMHCAMVKAGCSNSLDMCGR